MNLIVSLAAFVAAAVAVNAAEQSTSPPTGVFISSTGRSRDASRILPHPKVPARSMNLPSGQPAIIIVTPLLMDDIDSPNWAAQAAQVIADNDAGKLTTNTAWDSPTNYALCDHPIVWWDLVYSMDTPEWMGKLNPLAPFDQELGGPLVWELIDARASSGSNELSLDMISVTSSSPKDGDILGDTNGFVGDSYSSLAPLTVAETATNSAATITSGDASQVGARVQVLVCMKLFNGGDTTEGLSQVQQWVATHSPYSVSYTATVGGDSSTASTTTVSTAPIVIGKQPVIGIVLDTNAVGNVDIWVANATNSSITYQVWGSMQVPSTGNSFSSVIGTLNGTNVLRVPITGTAQFFSAKVQ